MHASLPDRPAPPSRAWPVPGAPGRPAGARPAGLPVPWLRAAALALGLLAGVLAGCGPAPRAPATAGEANPLVGRERRPARAAARPQDEVRVPVPAGARRCVVHVGAIAGGWLRIGREATARVSVDTPGGRMVLARRSLRVRRADHARWERIEADLPEGAGPDLVLQLEDGTGVQRAWWSARFDGLAAPGARNILLISLDTVRADAVGALGQGLPATPRLDALAARGTLYRQAISAAPWTLPSHVSVMTGVLPSWHGRVDPLRLDRELPALPTLATILGQHGYETAAITGSGSISWALGATRGFECVIENEPSREPRWWRSEEPECNRGARDALAFLSTDRPAPFFLFWHTYEPHAPHLDGRFLGTRAPLPAGVLEDAREDWLRYLGDLARADAALGAVLDGLERAGLAGRTDIIVMSDHGEDFGEHSEGVRGDPTRHGHGLFETQLRVPLIVVSPSVAPGARDEQVSLLDVFPTVLACAGLDAPQGTAGQALQAPGSRPVVFSEALYPRYVEHQAKSAREAAGLKYVATLAAPPREQLFDTASDPLDREDLGPARPADVERLRQQLLAALAGAPAPLPPRAPGSPSGQLPPEVLESLRSLGYVE